MEYLKNTEFKKALLSLFFLSASLFKIHFLEVFKSNEGQLIPQSTEGVVLLLMDSMC